MSDRYPYNNTSEDIADGANPIYETPLGAQTKADKAKQDAEEFSSTALNLHIAPENISAHSANSIVENSNKRFVTDVDKSSWNAKAASTIATTTTNGLMSATDKNKLDTVTINAQPNQNAFSAINGAMASTPTDTLTITGGVGITVSGSGKNINITATGTATPGLHASTHVTGGTDVIPDAVANIASGLFSGSDKNKLDGVQNNANNYTHPTTHPPSIIVQDTTNRFVTDSQIENWDAKETTSGSQTKANNAEINAKNYIDLKSWQKYKLSEDNGTAKPQSTVSLNNLTGAGFYAGSNFTDTPFSIGGQFDIFVIPSSGFDYIVQIAFSFNSTNGHSFFVRTRRDGVWYAWTRDISLPANNIFYGSGSPEGSVIGTPGQMYLNLNGGTSTTLYVKQSGNGNAGWVGK